MRIIYKTKVVSNIYLPPSAEILDIGMQGTDIVLWYSFEDQDKHTVLHEFRVVGTGHNVPNESNNYWAHMKTVIDGSYVWHIYKK